jgi:hypothetical protein
MLLSTKNTLFPTTAKNLKYTNSVSILKIKNNHLNL